MKERLKLLIISRFLAWAAWWMVMTFTVLDKRSRSSL